MSDQNVSDETTSDRQSVAVFTSTDQDNIQFDLVNAGDGIPELWVSDQADDKTACVCVFNPTLGIEGALATMMIMSRSLIDYATPELAEACGLKTADKKIVLPGDQ